MANATVTRPSRTTRLLHEVTAGHDPDSVAVRFHGAELTYGELERRSNQLAGALHRAGIGTGTVVALLLERGLDLPVAQLAVMKAGAAWMPLDPQHPTARLAFQIGDAAARLVLTTTELAHLAGGQTPRWCLDAQSHDTRLKTCPHRPPDAEVHPDDAAYLMYTSGSTGAPKGVLVPHRSAYAYCETVVGHFAITPGDRVAQVANPAFDAGIFDCFAALFAGATLISAGREIMSDPAALTSLLRDERVTLSHVPPAILAQLDPGELTDIALRTLISAGEALSADQANRWSRPGLELHNAYGPTETTVACTDYLCPASTSHRSTIPIGTALPGYRAYVLDQCLRPAPVGIPGQLFIAGTGVSHGYLGQPTLTAQRFLPDPYGSQPGERMYATGDRVRWRSDGVLAFLGRIDRQVKIHGQRVELGEIESVLTQHSDIRQCAVVLHDNSNLAAYFVGDADPGQVRTFLADRLPVYMIPRTLTAVAGLPLNANGKLDTARLPEPSPTTTPQRQPRTSTESWLADIWRELLERDRVSTSDTFFDLGANSLHTTQLATRVRERFDVQLLPQQLFANPTLEQLAARIDEARVVAAVPPSTDAPTDPPQQDLDDEIAALERLVAQKRAEKAAQARKRTVVPVPRTGTLACTFQQEGLWFVQQLDPTSSAYHIGFGMRLRGDLDVEALERALHALVVRHEALRTRFVEQEGVPQQVIDPPPAATLAVVDLPADRAETWATDVVCRPLDLAAGPVFRAALARVAPDEHVLALVVHHIVADGWSVAILAGELSMLYAGAVSGTTTDLPELPVQPADYAAWQRAWLDGPELERQLGFWRDRLAVLPTIDFPTDRPHPAQPTGAGARRELVLPDQLATAARAYCRAQRVSFLALLQAGLVTVLHRYTGQTDLPIGSVFSGRTRADIEPLVGFFANTLVLRTDVGGNPSFAEIVGRCHDTVLEASAHQDIPFSLVVDALQPDRVAGRNPLFQISLTLQPGRGGGGSGTSTLGGLTTEPVDVSSGHARFDLAIDVSESPDARLDLSVEYSTELFDADRIDRFVDHYQAALARGLSAPETAIADLEVLSPTERDQVLHAWNPDPVPRPPGLLHQVAAGHDPGRVAIRFGDDALTYGELEQRSNQLAHALRRAGIGTGDMVALLLDRGLDLPVAQLAVMKAGAGWVLLDPQLPPARLAFQTSDAAAPLVLTTTGLAALVRAETPHWCLDEPMLRARLAAEPKTLPDAHITPDDPAYLLYTSGSTGTPKGVLVPHRSAFAYCQNAVEMFATTPADRVAQVSNPAFDASIFDCFASLLAGATLIGVPRETLADPEALTALLRAEQVTLAYLPPAILALLDPDQLAGSVLRGAFSAGEALPPEQVRRWARPNFVLHNSYGPTETTVVCLDYLCPTTPPAGPVPIGTALPNHRAYVLDGRLRPVPIGVPGYLHIAGSGVAHGYLKRPSLTAQRFLPDPHGGRPGERMYATGDLVRWRSSGVLEYLGRGDRQVKLRGQRIELGEIEHVLDQHPAIRQSAVVLHERTTLAAYLVGDPDVDDVREFLAERLPTYMIPTAWMVVRELPVTPNGKLDTARLPDPGPASTSEYGPPRTETERWLAAVWQDLLEVDRVGVTDNFFDLGGNSLHATRLAARVREHLDLRLYPQFLFRSPTLEQLADHLDRTAGTAVDQAAVPDTSVLTLQARGGRPPLFLVHAVGGSASPYVQLALMLGDNRPVHVIEDPGLGGAPLAEGLAERARRYVEMVRRVQPDGPYHLGGWSLGGVIGLEMARQLTDAGAAVATVLALDSHLPGAGQPLTSDFVWHAFVRDVAAAADVPLPDISVDVLRGLDSEALEELALEELDKAGLAPADLRDDLRLRMRVVAANLRALYEYPLGAYDGRFVLVRAADGDPPLELARWRAATHLELRTAPGNHYTMLRRPQASALAAVVRDVLGD